MPQTARVDTFTVVVVVRAADGVDDAAVGDLSMWQDDADPILWRTSIDCAAEDLDEALVLGRELADGIVVGSPSGAAVEEVVAMDDERQLVWRANP